MAEHQAEIDIEDAPDAVFQFIVNPLNLPHWLPSIRETFREAPGRIRIVGGSLNHAGWVARLTVRSEPDANRLAWSVTDGIDCSGEAVAEAAGLHAVLRLSVRLDDAASTPLAVQAWTGDPELGLEGALRASLVAIKAWVEDRRTVVEPASGGLQSAPADDDGLRDSSGFGHSATMNSDVATPFDDNPDDDEVASAEDDAMTQDDDVLSLDDEPDDLFDEDNDDAADDATKSPGRPAG